MAGEGFCARILDGDAQDRIAMALHVVGVDKLVVSIDLLLKRLPIVGEEPLGHELLAPLVFHAHRDQDVTR